MKTCEVLIVLLSIAATATAQTSATPSWQKLDTGELILRPFQNALYPHPSREKGFKNFGPEHYQDSTVGIFIPANYKPGETVDYVVHFHGHKNDVANVVKKYKLSEQLVAASVNAILLVPQGPKDAADSGGGKLELDEGGFAKLIDEVTAYLNAEGKIHSTSPGKIVLSAHSGGYKVTAAILHHGGMRKCITDVILLDASYGSLEWFADWAKIGDCRLVSLYTEHLADENTEIMKLLDKANVKYTKLSSPDEAKPGLRGPIFSPVTVSHDEVPVKYFGPLVRSSALAGRG